MKTVRRITTTTRTVTYSYPIEAAAKGGQAIATARVHGRTRVVARGRVRGRKLTLTCRRLRRGHYRLTPLELRGHRSSLVIGHTTLVIT